MLGFFRNVVGKVARPLSIAIRGAGGALAPQISPFATAMQVGGSLLGGFHQDRSNRAQARNAMSYSRASDARQMAFQRASTARQMAFQVKQNQKAMDFSERMSSTAHQRQIRDLRKAGLNPILSGKYGGSSTPSGVTSAGSAPTGTSSAGVAARLDNIGAATAKQWMEAEKVRAQVGLLNQQRETETWRSANVRQDTATKRSQESLTTKQALTEIARELDMKRSALLKLFQTKSERERIKLLRSQSNRTKKEVQRLAKLMPVFELEGDLASSLLTEASRHGKNARVLVDLLRVIKLMMPRPLPK